MDQRTVDFPSKRLTAQLDRLRGCHACKDKKNCDRYKFVNDATNAIIEENSLEDSFIGQTLARSLSWAIADEAILSGIVGEGEEEFYYEDELPPLFYALESVREHIRGVTELIIKMHK